MLQVRIQPDPFIAPGACSSAWLERSLDKRKVGGSSPPRLKKGLLVQLAERLIYIQKVSGSNPLRPFYFQSSIMFFLDKNSKEKITTILSGILGLGRRRAVFVCRKLGYQQKSTLLDLDVSELDQLTSYVLQNFLINRFLKQKISQNIKSFVELGLYKGKRHQLGYPVRGQRTLCNGKSQKRLSSTRFYGKDSEYIGYRMKNNRRFSNKRFNYKRNKNFKFNKRGSGGVV